MIIHWCATGSITIGENTILSLFSPLYQLELNLNACDRQPTITHGFIILFKINLEAGSLGGHGGYKASSGTQAASIFLLYP